RFRVKQGRKRDRSPMTLGVSPWVKLSQQVCQMPEIAAQTAPPRRSRGGAEARRAARSGGPVRQQGFIKRNVPLYEPFTADQLELIEHNAELVLEEIGIDFRDDAEAISMWKD